MDMIALRRAAMLGWQSNIAYEAWDLSFNASKKEHIDTGVYLFNEKNINRDFEVVIENLYGSASSDQTIVCAKHNGLALGFIIRCTSSSNNSYAGTIAIKKNTIPNTITIRRINGVLLVEGNTVTNQPVPFNSNTVFDWPLCLGCAIDNNGEPYRWATGTIGHIVVRWLS